MKNQIPKNWQKVKLGEIAKIGTGSTNTQDAVVGGKYPLFDRSLDIKRSNKYLFDREAVIIPGEGKEFIPRFFSGKFDLHQRVYAIYSLQNEVLNKFLYYWFCLNNKYLSQYAVGSTVKSLRLPIFENLPVLLPPQAAQHRIISVLCAFDDKIEVNNKIAKSVEVTAQAIFKEWFVHFRFPGYEKVEFVESELGKIPKGCEIKPLTQVLIINPNISLKKGTRAPYIEMGDLLTSGMWFTSKRERKYKGSSRFQNGDTLLARITPSLEHGKTGYVNCLQGEATGFGSTEFIVFRPPDPNWREWVYLLARSHRLRDFAIRNMFGTSGRQRVPVDCFESFDIAIPPEELIESFHQTIEPMFTQIKLKLDENQKLAALRDLLLPKLMKGDIQV